MAGKPLGGESDSEARQCFIQAFKKLYPEKGMRGISGASLAQKAGYSRSTFYRCFESVYDVLRLVEIEATPYRSMAYLADHADTVDMMDITNAFLVFFEEHRDIIRTLTIHSDDNRYYERLRDCIKPVFRSQAERVYLMEPAEYDVLAEYITHAKLGLLRAWASGDIPMGLGHMTQITDSVLEGSLWDRVDEAAKSAAAGKPFERIPFEFFKDSHPWIHTRPLMEP